MTEEVDPGVDSMTGSWFSKFKSSCREFVETNRDDNAKGSEEGS